MMIGTLFLISALVLFALPTTPVEAQSTSDAEYIGSRDCAECHRDTRTAHNDSRHALTLQQTGEDPAQTMLADFSQGDDLRMVQFPGESEARPFTAADIAFSIGSGRYIQRYLYATGENQYAIFPAEWNVTEQVWQPYTLAETWPAPAYDWNTNCAGCHTTGYQVDSGKWEDPGVQCEACHGPGSTHADLVDEAGSTVDDTELAEIRGSIALSPDPQVCGQCHSLGQTSTNLPYPVNYRPGDELLSADVFTLVSPHDTAHWWPTGHGRDQNMQYNEWLLSGHADALNNLKLSTYADDSCLECHSGDYQWSRYVQGLHANGERAGDAPATINLQNAEFGVTCTVCHTMHDENAKDFQLSGEPYELCVSCHGDTGRIAEVHHPVEEMYEGIQIVGTVSATPSGHFQQGVECITCHMPPTRISASGQTEYFRSHTMALAEPGMVGEEQPDSCNGCHTDLSSEYMQQFLEKTQSGIQDRLSNVRVILGTQANIPEWVQTALDFVLKDGSLGVHNYAYATSLLDAAELELGISQNVIPADIPVRHIENPLDCAECHEDEYRKWQTSPHANSSLNQEFQQVYSESGRPSYCMRCHASGYDPQTENYVFEGVVCSNCHFVTSGTEHPPGPVEVAEASAVCGRCHSGEHAPTYDEWLASKHSGNRGIDCADCHSPHDNGLVLGDVNATCGACHEEAVMDEVHMGQDMTCVDCHMNRVLSENGIQVVQTGHTMGIDPGVCARCHGNTHLLSMDPDDLSDAQKTELQNLQEEVAQLENTATQNLNSGIVGGAIGALVLAVIVYFTIRLGRMK